jgi:general secretion pathway protein J
MNHPRRSSAGFTLVEMVLAIGIAVGILMVALYFYQQSSRLRAHILEESERLSAARLLLDRLTTDLRSALAQPVEAFQGDATSLRFVKAGLSGRSSRAGVSDLQLVTYATTMAREGTNVVVTGVSRTEEPLSVRSKSAVTNVTAASSATMVAAAVFNSTENSNSVSQTQGPAPLTDLVRYLSFSYWDGTGWVAQWSSRELPLGVTVTLAFDAVPEGLEAEDTDTEIFRRVIDLSAQGSNRLTHPASHAGLRNSPRRSESRLGSESALIRRSDGGGEGS